MKAGPKSATRSNGTLGVIVHYGDAALTDRAVHSMVAGDPAPDRVVVVDNGPGRLALALSGGAAVTVLRPGRNTGFAGAIGLALEQALRPGTRYVWLLNNDAIAEPGAFGELLAAAEAGGGHSLVSSLILEIPGDRVWFDEFRFYPWMLESRRVLKRPSGDVVRLGPPAWMAVPYLPGCSLLIPAAALREIGGLDQRYFVYGEDVDLAIRCARAGWASVLARRSVVRHRTSSATGRDTRQRLLAEGSLLVTMRHFPWLVPAALTWALTVSFKRAVQHRGSWPLTARLAGYRRAITKRG